METTKSAGTGRIDLEHAKLACKYSVTCPQLCVGSEALCNGSYERFYPFGAWSPLMWTVTIKEASA